MNGFSLSFLGFLAFWCKMVFNSTHLHTYIYTYMYIVCKKRERALFLAQIFLVGLFLESKKMSM